MGDGFLLSVLVTSEHAYFVTFITLGWMLEYGSRGTVHTAQLTMSCSTCGCFFVASLMDIPHMFTMTNHVS